MAYCKHCNQEISANEKTHNCREVGLLNIDEDDSFIVSAIIGLASDSAILGGLLGGDISGGIVGDILDGDLFD